MSLNITGKYITVFQVEDKGNYIQANLSTGKKNQDGTYTNMSWRARFVGKCKEKAKLLGDKDKIEIISGTVENSYNKEKKALYVNVTVFDFNLMQANKTEIQPDIFVPVADDSDLPF